jgi:tetratricopeptide (TPR) repeat protein
MLTGMNFRAASPAQQAAALVQRGFAAQQAGDTAGANKAYAQALTLQPGQPDALQLLGLMARHRGDLAQAERLMRASLVSREAQPHVWNNLGNVLADQARADEAEACYARAVVLAPTYADALYNLACQRHARGQTDAPALLLQAMQQPPGPTLAMRQLQAQMLADGGLLIEAQGVIDQALAQAPQHPRLHHQRAVLLQRRQRPAEALQAHQQALALGEDAADAHYGLGNTLQSLGRHTEAQAAYRNALARQPTHALAHYDLARLRWRLGDTDFDAELRQALQRQPGVAALALMHGQLLVRAERLVDAAQAFRLGLAQAAVPAPERAALHDGLGACLVRMGEVQAGLVQHQQALTAAPPTAEVLCSQATSLLIARQAPAAAQAAEAALALTPHHQLAWALLGIAWRALGDPRSRWLDDPQRHVGVYDLPPPPGWTDMASFNAALAEELGRLHAADSEAPVDQTLRHGTQTLGNIFEQGHPLVDALKVRLGQAIDHHIAQMPADAQHPLLRRRSMGWRYTDSWSSRLRRQGFHTDHVHPHGWLSSCYYVALPPSVADTNRRAGWIRFGVPDFDAGLADLVPHHVQPQPGRLLLFPSLSWHGTVPFSDDTPRLTIAFDVVPT